MCNWKQHTKYAKEYAKEYAKYANLKEYEWKKCKICKIMIICKIICHGPMICRIICIVCKLEICDWKLEQHAKYPKKYAKNMTDAK